MSATTIRAIKQLNRRLMERLIFVDFLHFFADFDMLEDVNNAKLTLNMNTCQHQMKIGAALLRAGS